MPRPVDKQELEAMLAGARRALSEAEAELDKAVREIRVELDGEKTGLTAAVEEAFAKLRIAKQRLSDLTTRRS